MTEPVFAEELGEWLPSAADRAAANQLRQILAAQVAGAAGRKLKVVDEEGKSVELVLAPALSRLLLELLRHVERGDAVTLVPVSQMLTIRQAADILNVSRPFLIGLLERGDIAFETVGRHRRIKAEELLAHKRARDLRRDQALADLAALDGESL